MKHKTGQSRVHLFLQKKKKRLKGIRRIERKHEIFAVLKNGKQWECPELKIFYTENELQYPRYIISIPKKSGTAIVRNRIKRTIKEFFRKNSGASSLWFDIFIRYNPKSTSVRTGKMEGALKKWCEIIKMQQHG